MGRYFVRLNRKKNTTNVEYIRFHNKLQNVYFPNVIVMKSQIETILKDNKGKDYMLIRTSLVNFIVYTTDQNMGTLIFYG